MKYFSDYDNYKLDQELNEKGFFSWLIRSRKFGDLFSLKKVVKMSKKLAELDYTYTKRLTEFQKANVAQGRSANALSIDDANELKSYEEEIVNISKRIDHAYGDSEFLMYTSEAIKNEEELKYIKKRRKQAKDNREKSNLRKLEKLTKTQSGLLKQQVEGSAPEDAKGVLDLSDVEKHKAKINKEKRDSQLSKLQKQKARLQTGELKARSSYMKTYYSDDSSSTGSYKPRNVPGKSRKNNQRTQTQSGNDLEII